MLNFLIKILFIFKKNSKGINLHIYNKVSSCVKNNFIIKKKIIKYKGYLSSFYGNSILSLNNLEYSTKNIKNYSKKKFFSSSKLILQLLYEIKYDYDTVTTEKLNTNLISIFEEKENLMWYYHRFFFKKHYFSCLRNKNIFLSSNKVHLALDNQRKTKFFYFILHNFFDNIFSNFHLFNIIYLYKYSYFRENNFNLLVRYNFNLKKYFFVKNNVSFIFDYAYFPKFYSKQLINEFTFMFFTKSLQNFSVFVKKLITDLGRVGQKKFYNILSGINGPVLISFLKKIFIFGFYLKSSGKIAGYAGDRTKLFYVRFGNYSRAIKHLRFLYKQTISFTRPGAIGTNFLLVFS